MATMTQEQIRALANEIADVEDDMNEVTTGGGGGFGKRFKPGWTIARFTSYIESGKHVELFQGKPKDPKPMCRLGFHLFSPDYLNDDGTPYFIETMDKPKDRNEKAWTSKTFRAMNYKQLAKAFPQLLNEIYLVEIVDYVSKNAPAGTEPRSVIGQITPGLDRLTNQPYGCPEAPSLFLFSWSKPTLEGWDALFIEGQNDKGKSKNWKQEKMAGATDFVGSPLHNLLVANQRPIPQGTPQKTGAATTAAAPAGAAAPSTAAVAPTVAPATAPVAAVTPAVAAPVVAAPTAPVVTAPAVAAPVVAAPTAPVVTAPAVAAPVVAPVVSAPVVAAPVVAPVAGN